MFGPQGLVEGEIIQPAGVLAYEFLECLALLIARLALETVISGRQTDLALCIQVLRLIQPGIVKPTYGWRMASVRSLMACSVVMPTPVGSKGLLVAGVSGSVPR